MLHRHRAKRTWQDYGHVNMQKLKKTLDTRTHTHIISQGKAFRPITVTLMCALMSSSYILRYIIFFKKVTSQLITYSVSKPTSLGYCYHYVGPSINSFQLFSCHIYYINQVKS